MMQIQRLGLIAVIAGGVLAVGLQPAEPPAAGKVSGTVRFTGTVPPPQVITTTDGGTIKHSDLVVESKTKGLRDVAVLLEDARPQPPLEKGKAVLVDQRDMIFLPRVLAIQHGQPVRFENNDLCNHSVQAVSKLEANQFNRIAGPGQPIEHRFEPQPRPVLIGCALHGWMRAWIYVLPHPWFALTDVEGRFTIDRIPPGKYTLLVTHADTGLNERRSIEVQAGKTSTAAIDWDSPRPK